MTESNDIEYYRRRERDERALADRATSAGIRAVHLKLAAHYAERIRGGEEKPSTLRTKLHMVKR